MSDFVAQKKRYTFGNDEFSLEAAYHDCKLVFDGITDDYSFQEADTGLILYYANEIIYALQETLEGMDKNISSNGTISRQDAAEIKAIAESCIASLIEMKLRVEKLPSAQPETPPYVAEIESEYKKWVKMPHINKPLAKALYEVWKKHDREDVSRNG